MPVRIGGSAIVLVAACVLCGGARGGQDAGAKAVSPTAKALETLKADVGTWNAEVSFWLRPGSDPLKSHAVLNATMDVGGMFLEQRFDGKFGPEMGNKAWTSLSYTGFNATTGEYEAARMASSSPTMITVRGKKKDDGTIEMTGNYVMMGMKGTQRDVIRHEGADKCTIETWMSFDGSPEFKGAEMVLTRTMQKADRKQGEADMDLGNFSVSLAVKDIAASRAFYEKLGFKTIGGDQAKNWLILQNPTSTIGLFQGVIPKNTLTFNPGWDRSCATLPAFEDVRAIQKALQTKGLELPLSADESSTGPASVMLMDPDGNPILIDQHVPAPAR